MNAYDLPNLPPHSVEAEQSVLGALLLENTAWERVADLINEQDFYRADHRSIWKQIVRLIDENKPADVVTVAEALESLDQLDNAGGLSYLAALAQNTPSSANIRRYAEIVREKADGRALAMVASDLADAIYKPDGRTASDLAREAEMALEAIANPCGGADEPVTARAAIMEVLRAADDGHGRRGLETGLADLDVLTGGLEPGQLVVIAARPGIGKTALALSVAHHVARAGNRVAFFSLEMTKNELASRLVAAEAQVPARCLRDGPLDAEWAALSEAATAHGLDGFFLDDRPAASLSYLRTRGRRLRRQGGLGLIVIDYLQLMAPADRRVSRAEQVGSLSRGLKALAKELHVPVIALAQLNREAESRADKRPMLSDLRDSGEVEQDADLVLLLSRASTTGDVLEANLAKHRQGSTGSFWLDFSQPTMSFRRRYGPPDQAVPSRRSPGFDEIAQRRSR
jgi:replicative DNA helicase